VNGDPSRWLTAALRLIAAVAALALATAVPTAEAGTGAATPKASITDIENDVMCVACRTPLAVAESPEAYSERRFIQHLIDQGQTKSQIERALVAQYGPDVLALPPAHGFNLTVYVLPPAIVLAGLVALAFALPRWRGRTRTSAVPPALDPKTEARLDEELARFDG
jgi:cytochrome c-type biogenesis protein CcmH/NrfF